MPQIDQLFKELDSLLKGDTEKEIAGRRAAIKADPDNLQLRRELHFLYNGYLS